MVDYFLADEDDTVDANYFRKLLKISPNTFAKLLRDGVLPMPLPLGPRIRRWSRRAVMNFLNAPVNYNTTHNPKI
jgi:predicted DNA-binding transcriptional regulator AlpA